MVLNTQIKPTVLQFEVLNAFSNLKLLNVVKHTLNIYYYKCENKFHIWNLVFDRIKREKLLNIIKVIIKMMTHIIITTRHNLITT